MSFWHGAINVSFHMLNCVIVCNVFIVLSCTAAYLKATLVKSALVNSLSHNSST